MLLWGGRLSKGTRYYLEFNWKLALFPCPITEADVSLEQASYSTEENDVFVTVCVDLTGELCRPVTVTVSTNDNTTTGQYYTVHRSLHRWHCNRN